MTRRGRPLCGESRALLAALPCGRRVAAADLAGELGMPLDVAVRRLSRLVAAGHIEVAEKVARPPARRPVALYAPAESERGADLLGQVMLRPYPRL